MIKKLLFLFLVSILLSSCGTINAVQSALNPHEVEKIEAAQQDQGCDVPHIYGGVFIDLCLINEGDVGVLFIPDLPLSFILDTVLLPISIPMQIVNGNIYNSTHDESTNKDNLKD